MLEKPTALNNCSASSQQGINQFGFTQNFCSCPAFVLAMEVATCHCGLDSCGRFKGARKQFMLRNREARCQCAGIGSLSMNQAAKSASTAAVLKTKRDRSGRRAYNVPISQARIPPRREALQVKLIAQ